MKAGDLYVENFPPDLRQAGKIAALRREETWRAFVIEAVRRHVVACALDGGDGREAEAAPASGPRVSKRP